MRRLFVLCLLLLLLLPSFCLASLGISLDIKKPGGGTKSIPLYKESHALLVGVSDYTNGWPDLNSVPGEVEALEIALKGQGFDVTKILNPDKNQLTDAYEDFIYRYGYDKENRLLFFFSGHGYSRIDAGKGYIVPSNAPSPLHDERGFVRKAIEMEQILTWARRIESKHAMFLFDSCFSGTVFQSRALPNEPPHISAMVTRPVRQFISSGSAGEEVPSRSVFVPSFIRAIKGEGDLDRDGYVTGTELGMYLNRKVTGYQTGQTPQYGKIRDPQLDEGDFVFINLNVTVLDESKQTVKETDDEAGQFWEQVKDSTNPAGFELFIKRYPESSMAELARIKFSELKDGAQQEKEWQIREQEILFWESIKDSGSADEFKAYLQKFPQGTYSTLAQLKIDGQESGRLARQQVSQQVQARGLVDTADKTEAEEATFWDTVRNSNSSRLYQAYLDKYPAGRFVDLALLLKEKSLQPRPSGTDVKDFKPKLKIAFLPIQVYGYFNKTEVNQLLYNGLLKLLQENADRFEIVATNENLSDLGISSSAQKIETSASDTLWIKKSFFSQTELNLDELKSICDKTDSDVALIYSYDVLYESSTHLKINLKIYLYDSLSGKLYNRSNEVWTSSLYIDNVAQLTHALIKDRRTK